MARNSNSTGSRNGRNKGIIFAASDQAEPVWDGHRNRWATP